MKRILLVVLCVLSFPVMASHIVGGEFEIIHLSDNNYRINLILYFDQLNGNPGARDQSVSARIFRKSDDAIMRDVFLSLASETAVSYTQPACSNGEIVTSRIRYTTTMVLSPAEYGDPAGYYIAWERCCRNYSISNVISNDPQAGGTYAGQTFYLEFPPVVKNGQAFYNSSPRLFPPLNDYACPNRPYYVDFAGVDDDGDSLVYSLVAPLNTRSADAIPPGGTRSRPYPNVVWRDPYNLANVLGGNPDLKVSTDGFITVTPTMQGLFVFAVRCEEYRDGEKIGEVRRDFQMLVVDNCPVAEPPQIEGKKLADADFTYDDTMNITFGNTTPDDERCIQVKVADPDSRKADQGLRENVKIKAIPLGFKADVSDILPADVTAVLTGDDSVVFDICFPACPYAEGPFQIGIVAMDDACSLPLTDTLKITVEIEPPANQPPYFITPEITETINEGDSVGWTITAIDNDGDPMFFGVVPVGFDLAAAGMTFTPSPQSGNSMQGTFTWDTRCGGGFNFAKKSSFEVWLVVEDIDQCTVTHPDVLKLNLSLDILANTEPELTVVSLNQSQPLTAGSLSAMLGNQINLGIHATDPDYIPGKDYIYIELIDARGTVAPHGYVFADAEGLGEAQTTFSWNPDCSIFEEGANENKYKFTFRVYDDHCYNVLADTVEVEILIHDVESSDTDFNPPNIITPNGDDCNDFFAMEGVDPEVASCGATTLVHLPKDNCDRRFEGIKIFNRWGRQVFESGQRDFRWYAANEPNGVYFYLLKYSDKEYKGSITVRY